jgi:hypothetical protein
MTFSAILLAFVLALAGCGGRDITSKWRDGDIVIDGIADEWRGSRTYIESPNIALGVMNDEEYLYLSLSTPVRSVAAQIVAFGMTVWLDAEGGERKNFGVRCPVGLDDFSVMSEAAREPDKLKQLLYEAAQRFEILGAGQDDTVKLVNDGSSGIEIAVGHRDGTFGYELRVPLGGGGSEYSVASSPGGKVGVGFETPELDMDEIRETMVGEMRGGPQRGGGGPGRAVGGGPTDSDDMGRGGMQGGRARIDTPEPLRVWAKVSLASR